ncbi:hypothetical protein glysoja_020079 [Glycine soja]|nr:hypothetical protein glysoja_020079 [Glycine soja]
MSVHDEDLHSGDVVEAEAVEHGDLLAGADGDAKDAEGTKLLVALLVISKEEESECGFVVVLEAWVEWKREC